MSRIVKLSARDLTEEERSKIPECDKTFPQIALNLIDEDNNEIHSVYMYPLRGYFFQIGGLNADGAILQGNRFYGGALGLIKNCRSIGMYDDNIIDIFNIEASACILDLIKRFTHTSNNSEQRQSWIKLFGEIDIRIDSSIGSLAIWHKDTVWSKFINYTFEFFDKRLKEEGLKK